MATGIGDAGDTSPARLGGMNRVDQPARLRSRTGRNPGRAMLSSARGDFQLRTSVRITLSVGVRCSPTTTRCILVEMHVALYRAKADGRGTVRFFGLNDQKLRDRRSMQHDLRSAIEHNELGCIISLRPRSTARFVALEALL